MKKSDFLIKFYKKRDQKGFILLFTLFLLFIIAVLTVSFFYIQFLEGDLISQETDSLQAFYLAQTGLSHGVEWLNENYEEAKEILNTNPNSLRAPNNETSVNLYPNENKQGRYDYELILDRTQANVDIIIINGLGIVNNSRRMVQREYTLPEGLPDPDLEDLALALDHTTSWDREPNFQDVPVFGCGSEPSEILTTEKSLTKKTKLIEIDPNQEDAISDFLRLSKRKILLSIRIENNDNELLFPDEDRRALYPNFSEGITSNGLSMLYGTNCPFVYTENRKSQGTGSNKQTIICQVNMTLKEKKTITLIAGLYFFNSLTLEKDSTINTAGTVQLLVNKLELKEGASLRGEDNNPNRLIILAEYNEKSPYVSDIEEVNIGAGAVVYAHIYAPRLELKISAGKGYSGITKVKGFIFAKRILAYRAGNFGSVRICHDLNLSEGITELPASWQEVNMGS